MALAFLTKIEAAGRLPRELAHEDRELLLSLCNDIRMFGTRRDIIREGERPDHVHLMIDGWSCRYKVLEDGSRQITAFLVPGRFLRYAHYAVRPDGSQHRVSMTDCRVAFIPRAKMLETFGAGRTSCAPCGWASLVDEAVLRAWIVNMGRRDALERAGHLICEMHARLRNVGMIEGGAFELPLTQEDMGDALGLSSVHINRVLKRLREQELVTFKRQQIVILDMPKLYGLVGFDPNYLHLSH